MQKSEIRVLKKVALNNPVLIEGLPGLGIVGKLACDHLISELKAEKFAELYSPDFPPQVMINPDATIRMMTNDFYYYKAPASAKSKSSEKKSKQASGQAGSDSKNSSSRDLIILVGDNQALSVQAHYTTSDLVLDFAQKHGTNTIFTLGGYGVGRLAKEPRVFGAVTDKKLIPDLKKQGVLFEKTGAIIGAAGLLLGLGKLRGLDGACLMGETHGNYVDPQSAKKVLEVLCKVLGLKIGFADLEKKAKETEAMISKFEQSQVAGQQQMPPVAPAPDERHLSYIR